MRESKLNEFKFVLKIELEFELAADFCALACPVMSGQRQVVTMRQLLLPYADALLHQWTAQCHSISK